MTITTLLIYIGIVSILLTLIVVYGLKADRNKFMSFVQNFSGALFVFSGFVKAVDPLGTAYKMQDYFKEFKFTFEETAFSFLGPFFDTMNEYAIAFSVILVVFEIILGVMLIIGFKPKLTAWLFFLMVLFFTVLTGFTYLTGYVPSGVNFFSFGEWGPYVASNMKVTDCGCFGDFIKLEPFQSFLKDVFLLFPAIYFVLRHKDMHQLFNFSTRSLITIITTIGTLIYGFSNFVWDIPHLDFRPFKIEADVASQRAIEIEAAANVSITAYKLQNPETGETIEVPYAEYLETSTKYKEEGWEVLEQVMTEPTVEATKLSEFWINDYEDNDVTSSYLDNENYRMMVVSYKMPVEELISTTRIVRDTIYKMDTLEVLENDSVIVEKIVDRIDEREETVNDYVWEEEWKAKYIDIVKPMALAAKKDGIEMAVVLGGADINMALDFAGEMDMPVDYENADDILLKTIVRSNPGFVLWKDGTILDKWHVQKVPSYEEIKEEHIK